MNIVFFATSLSTNNGGINSFNYSLLKELSKNKKIKLYCIVKDILDEYKSQKNIKIIEGRDNFIKPSEDIYQEFFQKQETDSIIWAGHDAITGNEAIFYQKKYGGKSVVFHHMDYSNYSHLKNKNNHEKIFGQNKILKEADIVIAIGPRLFDNAKRLRNTKDTYEITPGAFESEIKLSTKHNYRISLAGRLDPSENTVKNTDIAIKSAAEILSECDKNNGSITIIGASHKDLPNNFLSKYNQVAINCIPYTNDRAVYAEVLSDSDLLIMPSVKEGFGLVAWEASSIGLPIIISKSSGYYYWLEKRNLEKHVTSIQINGIPAFDAPVIKKAIRNLLSSYSLHSQNALILKEKIISNTWKKSSEKFLDIVGFPKEKTTSPEKHNKELSILEKPVKSIFENYETIVSITNKKRECLITSEESTNFSKGKRIKYELWHGPLNKIHYLFIQKSSNISQTIEDFRNRIKSKCIDIKNLILIKSDKTKSNSTIDLRTICDSFEEYTIKDYIWNHCIDSAFKEPSSSKIVRYYIEQNLLSNDGKKISRSDFLKAIESDQESAAHIVIAPGGMGKTYLTRSIYNSLQEKTTHQVSILIEAEFIKKYIDSNGIGQIKIQSLYDLYDLYIKSSRNELRYEKSIFELSVLSGSLIIIIDGLDELITKLLDNFDLVKFSKSIFDLSNSLSSGKIIITTRDSNILTDDFLLNYDFRKYDLLGFTQEDLILFITKKTTLPKEQRTQLGNKFLKYLETTKLHDKEKRISPFVADIISDIVIEEFNEDSKSLSINNNQEKIYDSCDDPIDTVIQAIFIRERKRQKFDQLDTTLIMLIAEKFSQNGESVKIENLASEIEIYYGANKDEIFSKISINPLFRQNGNYLSLKYDFLESYLRSIFIINNIINHSTTKESLISIDKINDKNSNEYSYTIKYFRNNKKTDLILDYLKLIKNELNNFDDQLRNEYAKKSISALLKIYQDATGSTTSKLSLLISELFNSEGSAPNQIDNLYIIGDFPKIDLSELTITSSKFIGYKNICKSQVENSRFIDCIFENCYEGSYLDQTFAKANFEASCKLGDLEQHINRTKQKDEMHEKNFEEEYKKFVDCFFENGSLFDPKHEWINFSNKIPMLTQKNINKLIPRFLVIKSEKAKGTHYTLSHDFSEAAFAYLESGKKERIFLEFVEFIRSK